MSLFDLNLQPILQQYPKTAARTPSLIGKIFLKLTDTCVMKTYV